MIINNEFIDINNLSHNDLVIDIETTGFSSTNNTISMIGIIAFDSIVNSFYLKQIFSENYEDESNLLKEFLRTLDTSHRFLSFNGLQFDIPFIQNRLTHHGFEHSILKQDHIDLYDYMRKNAIFTGMKPCGQKDLEKLYGLERPFEMSGKTAVELYKSYVNYPNVDIYNKMSLYNKLDVLYLAELFEIYFDSQKLKTIPFSIKDSSYTAIIDSISLTKDILTTELTTDIEFEYEIEDIRNYYVLKWDKNKLIIKMNTITGLISQNNMGTCFNYSDLNGDLFLKNEMLKADLVIVKESNFIIENLKKIIHEMIVESIERFVI